MTRCGRSRRSRSTWRPPSSAFCANTGRALRSAMTCRQRWRSFAVVKAERADLAHNLSAFHVEVLRRVLRAGGDAPALAEPAFEVAYEARQQVKLYPDVPAALDRMAAR